MKGVQQSKYVSTTIINLQVCIPRASDAKASFRF